MKKFLYILVPVLLSAAISFFVSVVMLDDSPSPDSTAIVAEAEGENIQTAAEKLFPSVVGISAVNDHSFSLPGASEKIGSGVVVSREGHILTNHHVMGDSARLFVTLTHGETRKAEKIWGDPSLDLAIIRAEGGNFTPATLGDAQSLVVGETVLAIGNPLSLQFQRTVTAGIVSAKNRSLYSSETGAFLDGLIQTDASINPGNSGGPLINLRGEVVGINTAKARDAEGMGFSIPVNLCRPIVERILKDGKYEMAYLGIYAYDRETATYMDKEAPLEGLYVSEVIKGSPAGKAGLLKGDVITAIGDTPLPRMVTLRENLLACRPEDTVSLSVLRNGTPFRLSVKLEKEP